MSKRIFTKEQIEDLTRNPNVARCSEKSITYSKNFKIKAIELHNEQGLSSSEIFRQSGFNLNVIGRKIPKECLKRWKKIYKSKGADGLSEKRGTNNPNGRPKTKNLTDAEKIKGLEAKVAYLKAENDFLAKLRAKRAE